MRASLLPVALFLASCSTAPQPTFSGDAACTPAIEDKAWLTRAPEVWPLVARDVYAGKPADYPVTYALFDMHCAFTSPDGHSWTAKAHTGALTLPDGQAMPAQVASFAAPAPGGAMMVMALPSIWRADDVTSEMGLERLMFAVLAHEMTHTRQFSDYGARIDALAAATGIGEDMTDDVIQDKFVANAEFAASVERERDLLFAAAAEHDGAKARALAREAMMLITARRAKWLSGDAAPYAELEDIFLTMEGEGQFAGYSWLAHPGGGGLAPAAALTGLRRGKRWSQDLGLAMFLAIDRLTPGQPSAAFASPPHTVLALLRAATQGD